MSIETSANRVLASLSASTLRRLLANAERVDLARGQILAGGAEACAGAYFPFQGIISLQMLLSQGGTLEVGLVGRESLLVVWERQISNACSIWVRRPGEALRVSFELLFDLCRVDTHLNHIVQHRWAAIIAKVSQVAVCNRHHRIDQQLCRWLLDYLDHDDLYEIIESQESIAAALGVRREGVSEALGRLQKRGAIAAARRSLRIIDRRILEAEACECYEVIRAQRRMATAGAPSL